MLLTAGACGGGDEEQGGPSGEEETTARSPFTGRTAQQQPVLAVKLDNARVARPHTGLAAADLVYVEQVEGGLSRLMAVYSSRLPDRAGPVRSARESDLELLRQFGEPALAYSGVRSALRDDLRSAPLVRVPPAEAGDAYVRSGAAAPHNLYVRPEAALSAAPGASEPRDIGFRFGPAPDGGSPEDRRTVRYPSARFAFSWSGEEDRWLVTMDGSPARTTDGTRLGAPTVVVQEVTMRPSRFRDTTGAVTPYIESVGSGEATVLRNGRAYDVTWERPSAADGTVFTRQNGERMPFARGPVWIVYAER
ncbi:DUF3048 domain-containing protein [Streptomyces sp. JJ36]|nr:DUF3048 domain-containing protein [Streptomyces sp. JJ36]